MQFNIYHKISQIHDELSYEIWLLAVFSIVKQDSSHYELEAQKGKSNGMGFFTNFLKFMLH